MWPWEEFSVCPFSYIRYLPSMADFLFTLCGCFFCTPNTKETTSTGATFFWHQNASSTKFDQFWSSQIPKYHCTVYQGQLNFSSPYRMDVIKAIQCKTFLDKFNGATVILARVLFQLDHQKNWIQRKINATKQAVGWDITEIRLYLLWGLGRIHNVLVFPESSK